MGSEALLQRACELAFAVAREDAEADPAVEPPGDMRSFLYLARLPRRAIAVAQQAIEDDSDFRTRVAERASEEEVGRAGYLWLHRPIGWAPEFEELSHQAEVDHADGDQAQIIDVPIDDPNIDGSLGDNAASDNDVESLSATFPEEPNETVSSIFGTTEEPSDSNGDHEFNEFVSADVPANTPMSASDLDPEADAIESELTSLRGLVDRLAGERELVMSGSQSEPGELPDMSHLEDEIEAVTSELDTARHELTMANDELAAVRQEREDARRQQSEALKRQVEVERELAAAREERAEIERNASDLQVNLISVEDRLKRIEGELEEVERERNVTQSQLETMTAERNQIREDRLAIKAERDSLQSRLTEVDEKTGGVDVGELTSANRSLTQELEATSRELARMIAQVESYEEQLQATTTTADALKSEKVELTSRLADAELALETTRTQHTALKDDAERLAADVGSLRAERDGLQSQLTELQASLSDVLDEHAEIRHRNDADRKSLNELRVERDVLLARMSDIEQADRSHENRINALVKERDDLLSARDDLMNERGELRGEVAAAASARDQLLEKIDALETKMGPLEVELQAERRQREELANRLLELDDIAATNQAALAELTTERDVLSRERIELGEQVEALQAEYVEAKKLTAERDELTARLTRTEEERDEEAEKRLSTIAELTEQVSTLESGNTNLENQISEAQSELTRVRSDIDELNRENAKLRFNLQVAESSVTEATDAAEEARQSAAEASARAAAAEARAERAEAASAEAALAAPLAGLTEIGEIEDETTADEAEPEAADDEAKIDESADSEDSGADEAVEAEATDDDESDDEEATVAADDEVVDATEEEPADVETEEEPADVETEDKADAEVEPADEEPADAEDDTVTDADADAGDEAEALPSLLSSFDGPSSEGDADLDEAAAQADETADELVGASADDSEPVFAAVEDVVGAEQQADVGAYVNDWKPVGGADSEPDELDEISELISQTVSGFDQPVEELTADAAGLADTGSFSDAGSFPDTGSFVDDVGAHPPSVFDSGDVPVADLESFGDLPSGDQTGEYGVSARRQIEIPPEIVDDEIAVAQHVVSSPDVVLLVDGDSVAKLGWPSLPVAQQRDALVTYLADLSGTSGAAPDVVFDGRIGDDESLPVSRAVRIRLSTPPTEPAAALDELVSAYPDQWPIALVTDDPGLATSAQERGAVVLNNGQLLDLFIAQ